MNGMVYPSLNIDFPKEYSLFWLDCIKFSRKLWFDTIGFFYLNSFLNRILRFKYKNFRGKYLGYAHISSANVLSLTLVAYWLNRSDVNTIVKRYYFIIIICCYAAVKADHSVCFFSIFGRVVKYSVKYICF